jgi:hypothetical protein
MNYWKQSSHSCNPGCPTLLGGISQNRYCAKSRDCINLELSKLGVADEKMVLEDTLILVDQFVMIKFSAISS